MGLTVCEKLPICEKVYHLSFMSQMDRLALRLAVRLRELRGDVSQLQYSKKLGISHSSLNRMELGEQNVTLEMLDTLCARLKCDIHDLIAPKPPKRRTK